MATRLNVTGGGRLPLSYPPRAGFEAQLTNSVIPTSSMGGITYTRATIATVTDNEGVIRNVKSGETRFQGARRVENIAIYSQAIDNANWNKYNSTISGTKVAYADGTLIGQTIVEDSTNTQHAIAQSVNYVTGDKYILSFSAKSAGRTFVQMLVSGTVTNSYQNFDLTNGTCSGTASAGTITAEGDGWYRCSMSFTSIGTTPALTYALLANSLADARFQAYLGAGVSGVSVTRIQVQNVTGQSVQTPAEYVSTNVLSSPFHGAMVDGVKYFDTDISGNQLSPDGFLCEGARTNLFIDSEDFSLWTLGGTGSITTNATTAPDGRMTADLFTLSTSNEGQSVSKTITTTAVAYGFSVYVKPNGHNYVQLLAAAGINAGYINFDLLTGVIGTSSGYTGRIESLPNGWYRIKATTPTVTAATGGFLIAPVPNASASRGNFVSGTGSSGVYLWGASLEVGQNASTYIPTTTVAVTRNADALSYNVSNVVSAKGAAYLEFTMGDVPSVGFDRRTLALSGNTNNRFQLVATSTTNNRTAILVGNGSSVMGTDLAIAMSTGSYSKMAGKWVNSSVANLFQNGSKSTDLASPVVAVTQIDVGTAGGNAIFGSIKNLKVWKSPPTDSELQALTTI